MLRRFREVEQSDTRQLFALPRNGKSLYTWVDAPFVGGQSNEEILLMADTVKKTKAPAKPRKTAAAKTTAEPAPVGVMPSHQQIEQLARNYWAQRGFTDGYAEQDWLRAEHELRQKAS